MSLGRSFQLTWLGHSTFVLRTSAGKSVLFDPWVAHNPACPEGKRKLDKIDLMLITHGHFDHIEDAVEIALEHQPEVVGIFETCLWLGSKGVTKTHDMNKGGTVSVCGLDVTMVRADHSCGIKDKDPSGRDIIVYGGEPCGYIVRLEDGYKIYYAGDTNVFSDMKLIGELYRPDAAFLPIGGHYTMSPREAAVAVEFLGVKTIVPMHYGTFPVLAGTPEMLREATRKLEGVEIFTCKPGELVP